MYLYNTSPCVHRYNARILIWNQYRKKVENIAEATICTCSQFHFLEMYD